MKALIVLLALILFGAHVWLSRQLHDGDNESILREALTTNLQESFGEDVSIRYDYIDGILEGSVADQQASEQAEDIAKEHRIAGRIINRLEFPGGPPAAPVELDPATFSTDWDGENLTLRGRVPNDQIKSSLATAAVGLGAAQVINELEVSDTTAMPAWATSMPAFLAKFLAGTDSGQIEATSATLRLKRSTDGESSKSALLANVGDWGLNLEDQISIAKTESPEEPAEVVHVIEKPAPKRSGRLSASLKNKALTLTGLVPDEATKSSFAADAATSGFQVINNLEVADDVKALAWGEPVKGFLGDFFNGASAGKFEIDSEQVLIDREIPNMRSKLALTTKAKALLPSGKLSDRLRFAKKAPDFDFGFKREDGKLRLTGWLPNMDIKDKILGATKQRYPDLQIDDGLQVSPNVKMPKWGGKLPEFTGKLPDMEGWQGFRFSGRGIDFGGMSEGAKAKFAKVAGSSFGTKFPRLNWPKPKPVAKPTEPAAFLAKLKNNTLRITGKVPSESLKQTIAQSAAKALPKAKIINDLKVDSAKVMVPKWDRIDSMIVEFLAQNPKAAEFELNDKLRLKREMVDASTKDTLIANAHDFWPGGNCVIDQLSVKPPKPKPQPVTPKPAPQPKPRVLANLKVSLRPNKIDLTGQLPNKQSSDEVVAGLANAYPQAAINNQIKLSKQVAETTWTDELGTFFEGFPTGADRGEVTIKGKQVAISGLAKNQAMRGRLSADLAAAMPSDYQVDNQLKVPAKKPQPKPTPKATPKPEPKATKLSRNDLKPIEGIPKFYVHFDTASHWVHSDGQYQINSACEAGQKLTGAKPTYVVQGFADSRGNQYDNQSLSERRAGSVVYLLKSKDVNAEFIYVDAVGESESYDRGDSKWDRRVEITLMR